MTTARISRRSIDPYTFRESISIEFIRPRGLEDSILDDQLAAGMAYAPPKEIPVNFSTTTTTTTTTTTSSSTPPASPSKRALGGALPPPPPRPLKEECRPPPPPRPLKEECRPPTPPKARDKTANSPRKSPRRNSQLSPLMSPNKIKAVRLTSPMRVSPSKGLADNLSKISQDDSGNNNDSGDQSSSHHSSTAASQVSTTLSSLLVRSPVVKAIEAAVRGQKTVRFSDELELNEISKLQASLLQELFYGSEDLAEFRYEAFMEEAGLDASQFD